MIAYLALGSNIGDREKYLKRAVEEITEENEILAHSSLYETEPVGYENQGWFLNAVIKIQTSLSAEQLLQSLLAIEKRLERTRTVENGPRTIDIDVLFYDSEIIQEDGLEIPHPRLQDRSFVLIPLVEVAPRLMHPRLQKTVGSILRELQDQKGVHLYKKHWL
ncbi:2-amino-4-hydroxy-6-hydroxymethyldihydropteridine diphosphokinase [Patescibacteria group bacterium]|nr:2-amino-4-hydroxy-6-hydroxymethyldihydropteridine diphosphokinase [Patescibacteria group bacterium]